MHHPRRAAALSLLLALSVPSAPALAGDDGAVAEVVRLLAGTFDSKAQSEADPEGFRNIQLTAVVVPKSLLGRGAPVLYLEQALAETPDKPYRQRFYRIEDAGDGKVVSRVFEPKDVAAVRGKWRQPEDLAVFGAGDVVERAGCAVALQKKGEAWEGGTDGKGCPSALRGAAYATSAVSLSPGRMESWDRGYAGDGKQVWGATKGPYVFVRRAEAPAGAPVKPAAPLPY